MASGIGTGQELAPVLTNLLFAFHTTMDDPLLWPSVPGLFHCSVLSCLSASRREQT